jgi:hypothetical protein
MEIKIKGSISKVFLIVLVGLASITAARSELPGLKEKEKINVYIESKGPKDFSLRVHHQGVTMDWQGDTFAIASWWNKNKEAQSQAVSSINGWKIEQKYVDNVHILNCSQSQLGFSFQIELVTNINIMTVNVPSSGIKEVGEGKLKSIRLLPYFGAAKEGEEGYLAIAKEVGALCYYNKKEPKEYKLPVYSFNGINMPLFGMVRGTGGITGIVTSGQFDAQFCVNTNWGPENQYSIDTEFNLRSFKDENRLSDDLTLEYHFLSSDEASWAGIGKCYRQYNFDHRGIRPLKQRMAKSSGLAYASEAMEVRLRLGVKPVPYKITEQTLETEPPVRVFLTFKQVRDIFDEFHKQGISDAEFCLVGWNIGGHDGRYPQLFPVEPVLGGEEELRKTIKYGQSLGYQIVAHNCYWDAYRIANNWNESYLRKKADGQLWKGGQWGGGQSYQQCLGQSYELFAKSDLPKIKDFGFKGLHYTDVLSILSPQPCYDSNHPETRRQDAEASNRILALCDSLIGGVQSEGPLDFTAPVLDRFLYTSIHTGQSTQLDLPYIDKNIPLHATVYHGVITYNLDNRTFNSLPGEKEYLENIEYGGIPAVYFYGHFYIPGSGRENWIGNRDYRFDSQEGLKEAVAGIGNVFRDFASLKHLQMEFIEGHNQLKEGVFETIYSNGESVVVNYNDTPYRVASGEEIPSRGFKLIKKQLN